jgi:hypothetical protein
LRLDDPPLVDPELLLSELPAMLGPPAKLPGLEVPELPLEPAEPPLD